MLVDVRKRERKGEREEEKREKEREISSAVCWTDLGKEKKMPKVKGSFNEIDEAAVRPADRCTVLRNHHYFLILDYSRLSMVCVPHILSGTTSLPQHAGQCRRG